MVAYLAEMEGNPPPKTSNSMQAFSLASTSKSFEDT